jgi:hypothetical protein
MTKLATASVPEYWVYKDDDKQSQYTKAHKPGKNWSNCTPYIHNGYLLYHK